MVYKKKNTNPNRYYVDNLTQKQKDALKRVASKENKRDDERKAKRDASVQRKREINDLADQVKAAAQSTKRKPKKNKTKGPFVKGDLSVDATKYRAELADMDRKDARRARMNERRREQEQLTDIIESEDEDFEDDVERNFEGVELDISHVDYQDLKRLQEWGPLLNHMSPHQIKGILSDTRFDPNGRPIIIINRPRKRKKTTQRYKYVDTPSGKVYF